MIDPFAELVQFDEALSDLDQRVRGRMARVASSDGHMVTVELPGPSGWDGPLGPYPATVAGLAPGRMGVLVPLRGGQALFVVTGYAPEVVAIGYHYDSSQSTTSITTPQQSFLRTHAVAGGTWRVSVHGAGSLSRSVQSGQVWLGLTVNGVTEAAVATYSTPGHIALTTPWTGDVVIPPEGGVISVELAFRGAATAATTSAQGTAISGMAIRIG